MKNRWSLNKKMTLPVLCLAVFTLSMMTFLSTWKTRSIVESDAYEKLQMTARNHSMGIEMEMESAFETARVIAMQNETDVRHGYQGRKRAVLGLRHYLEKNPALLGVWFGYEPNAYDGQDSNFKNQEYHEASGLFIPWWARSEGKLVYETLISDKTPELGTWYTLPKERKLETLVEPYSEEVGNTQVMMTSTVVPILREGKFVGVAAADIALNDIQNQVQQIKPYPGANAFLISYAGNYVSSPNLKEIGKKSSYPFESDKIIGAIKEGKALQIAGIDASDGQEYIYTVSPLTIGATRQPWSLVIRTPASEVLKEVKALTMFQVVVALIGVLSLGLTVTLIAKRISRQVEKRTEEIESSAHHVNQAIEQLSIAGQSLSQSSSSSAAALEQTVASLEEMTSMVKMNSDNARQAASLSAASSESAIQGESEMKDLLAAMQEISQSSKKIEEIINVIDDIAFQTNLLALNASVEAARAGEQGKGFAVVAEAVRTLAQRSAEAAKDITGLIKDSVEKIERGTKKADISGEVLSQIVNSVKKVSDLNTEISAASEEQAVGIQQISKAMTDLDQSVQSNAASSEEIASTAEDIRRQSHTMRDASVGLRHIVVGGQEQANAELPDSATVRPLVRKGMKRVA